MPTRAQMEQLRQANRVVQEQVTSELEAIFFSLDLNRPEAARDALLELMPLLVDKYGPIAAQVSADWYREVLPGLNPVLAPQRVTHEQAQKRVRYAAGHLFTEDPFATIRNLTGALGRYVRQQGRETLQISAQHDNIGWARVPTGARTCSFCLMLTSRSAEWLYTSKPKAQSRRSDGHDYHDLCNCEAVPVRNTEDLPDGFDYEGAYAMYGQAVEVAGNRSDTKAILENLRRLYPDVLTDGVHDHL